MAIILADDIFKCIFLNENDRIPIQIYLNCSEESNWQWASIGSGNVFVPEPRMTQFNGAYMQH